MLALGYMSYLKRLPPHHYTAATLRESVDLAVHEQISWFVVLHRISSTALQHPVNFPLHGFVNKVTHMIVLVEQSAHRMRWQTRYKTAQRCTYDATVWREG
jgi:hypothetical protein